MGDLYVPDKAYLVCTDGMKMQQIKVDSQHTIYIANGRLAATIKDRTGGNFICAKMIIATAIAAAIICAIVIIAAPAAITIGAGAAMAAAAAGGAVVGGLIATVPPVCALLTKSNDWVPVHPRVKFEKHEALIAKSVVPCILKGQVLIHYSKEAAQAAVDLKRKETAFKLVFIIAASYLAAPAVEGAGATMGTMGKLLKAFKFRAFASYAGSIGVGLGTNFALDRAKDEAKKLLYNQTPLGEYMEGYDTDIDHIRNATQPKGAEEGGIVDPYDDSKRLGESAKAAHEHVGNRIGNYETIEYESRTVANDASGGTEQYRYERVSSASANGISERNPTVTNLPERQFSSDRNGTFIHEENYRQEVGREYRPLTADEHTDLRRNIAKSWGKDYFKTRPKFTGKGVEGGGLIMDLVQDAYKGVTNFLLKGDIQDYIDALNNAENTAKKGVKVSETQI